MRRRASFDGVRRLPLCLGYERLVRLRNDPRISLLRRVWYPLLTNVGAVHDDAPDSGACQRAVYLARDIREPHLLRPQAEDFAHSVGVPARPEPSVFVAVVAERRGCSVHAACNRTLLTRHPGLTIPLALSLRDGGLDVEDHPRIGVQMRGVVAGRGCDQAPARRDDPVVCQSVLDHVSTEAVDVADDHAVRLALLDPTD